MTWQEMENQPTNKHKLILLKLASTQNNQFNELVVLCHALQ